jgi:hypothetical protein
MSEAAQSQVNKVEAASPKTVSQAASPKIVSK